MKKETKTFRRNCCDFPSNILAGFNSAILAMRHLMYMAVPDILWFQCDSLRCGLASHFILHCYKLSFKRLGRKVPGVSMYSMQEKVFSLEY